MCTKVYVYVHTTDETHTSTQTLSISRRSEDVGPRHSRPQVWTWDEGRQLVDSSSGLEGLKKRRFADVGLRFPNLKEQGWACGSVESFGLLGGSHILSYCRVLSDVIHTYNVQEHGWETITCIPKQN